MAAPECALRAPSPPSWGGRMAMSTGQMEERLENVERRVDRNEQILPTLPTRGDLDAAIAPLATRAELRAAIAPLATRAELRAAIAPLATKAELRAAIAPLATKAELREVEQRLRTHFDVVTESLGDDIRLVAEAVVALSERVR